MKKSKRVLSLVLCAAVMAGAFTTFSGCTKKTDTGAAPSTSTTGSSAKKVLRVGMECGYAPFNWTQTNADNGAVPISNAAGQYACQLNLKER